MQMNYEELAEKMTLLVEKYIPERSDLIKLINEDNDSVKYILAEIDRNKNQDYETSDLELLKEIAYYFL